MFRSISALAVMLCISGAAGAATVMVTVTGADGRPLPGAVVTIMVPKVAAPVPHGIYIMAQRNIAFDPHVLIVPAGATVSFPNRDTVRHHVYSFSTPKKFDLKLYGRDETKSVTFDKPGIVSLGCNIHDVMSGFIFVTSTPFAAVSDASGRVTINNVPAGRATLNMWHPSVRAPGNSMSQAVAVAPTGLTFAMSARR